MPTTWDWGDFWFIRKQESRNPWTWLSEALTKGQRQGTPTWAPRLTWAPGIEEQNELSELVGCDGPLEGVNVNFQKVPTHRRHGRSTQAHLQGGGPVGLQWGYPRTRTTMICQAEHSSRPLGQVWQWSWEGSRTEALWGDPPPHITQPCTSRGPHQSQPRRWCCLGPAGSPGYWSTEWCWKPDPGEQGGGRSLFPLCGAACCSRSSGGLWRTTLALGWGSQRQTKEQGHGDLFNPVHHLLVVETWERSLASLSLSFQIGKIESIPALQGWYED